MTSSAPAAPPGILLGDQRPRICSVPPCETSAGQDAVELVAAAGIELDPWQAFVLEQSLGERDDGKWAAFEVGLIVARQNGKGTILEARELAGLFLFGEQLILHSAHEFKTAADAFRRISALVEDNRQFSRHVRQIRTANGSEMIELKSGQRLRFVARSAGSGRGFSADAIILDEAYNLGDQEMAALLPTLSARPNPQVWYASTAGNDLSVQLGRIRRRGLKGGDKSLAFFEWSAEEGDDPEADGTWAKANPGLGYRISEEYIYREHATLSAGSFASERLSIGTYPIDENGWGVISEAMWDGCADEDSARPGRPIALALDVMPGERTGTIAIAGARPDGRVVGEIPGDCHRPGQGTSWMIPRAAELAAKYKPVAIVIDARSPAACLLADAERARLDIVKPTTADVGEAFGLFWVSVNDRAFCHLGRLQPELRAAVAGAARRDIGDGAHAWARKSTNVDISPLVSICLAHWAFAKFGARSYDVLRSVR